MFTINIAVPFIFAKYYIFSIKPPEGSFLGPFDGTLFRERG
jgi:hypothetical protein